MLQLPKTLRRAIALAAASAVLSCGGLAAAQAPDAETQVQAKNDAAVAVALGVQPIAPAQLARGGRYVRSTGMEAKLDEMLPFVLDPIRDAVLVGTPAAHRAVAVPALDEAAGEARIDLRRKLVTALTRYYAASLEAEALDELAIFNESPLGRKALRAPTALSPDERQAVGAYSQAHPAMSDLGPILPGGLKVTEVIVTRETTLIAAAFKARLCQALKARNAAPAACAAA